MDSPASGAIASVVELYRNEEVDLNSHESNEVIEKGLKMANKMLAKSYTEMSEEERIFIFQASISSWYKQNTCLNINEFTVYDFLNQPSGVYQEFRIHSLPLSSSPIILADLDLLTGYFKLVRPAFIHRNLQPERRVELEDFNELTSSFFINSTGRPDFRAGNVIIQFIQKVNGLSDNENGSSGNLQGLLTVDSIISIPILCDELVDANPTLTFAEIQQLAHRKYEKLRYQRSCLRSVFVAEKLGDSCSPQEIDSFCEQRGWSDRKIIRKRTNIGVRAVSSVFNLNKNRLTKKDLDSKAVETTVKVCFFRYFFFATLELQ